ncbi:hypothetical protein WR25_00025 [Diploscapter pachys]|uniref:Uncharacterized protein n=1 Tax=Diploscapter pachys TaxID=2018661 RepID=A0A2A2KDY8_9BILA|nr:hypothetical protein WR25_00025 [Diploscapter pachys]
MEWLRGRLYGFVEPRIERIELIDEFDPDEQQPQSSRMAATLDLFFSHYFFYHVLPKSEIIQKRDHLQFHLPVAIKA